MNPNRKWGCVNAVLVLIFSPAVTLLAADLSRAQIAMGTLCEIKLSGPSQKILKKASQAAFKEILQIEKRISSYRKKSETNQIKKAPLNKPFPLSNQSFEIFTLAKEYNKLTQGVFDVTLSGKSNAFVLDPQHKTVTKREPIQTIDFGGIGKGYAMEKALALIKNHSLEHVQINFGGQILCWSKDRNSNWITVSIQHPTSVEKTVGSLLLTNGSVATSARFRRSYGSEQDDTKPHIINPVTGAPASFNGSVTVVSSNAIEADVWSTAFFILGPEKGLVQAQAMPNLCVIYAVPHENQVHLKSTNSCRQFHLKTNPS